MKKEEQMRDENFEYQKKKLEEQGYIAKKGTISVLMANVLAIVIAIPMCAAIEYLYVHIWGEVTMNVDSKAMFICIVAMLVCIVIHEWIHGFTWHFFCKEKWKSIHIGFQAKLLTPYCHCKEPLAFKGYLLGGLMPGLVLGFGVSIVGIIMASPMVTVLGMFNLLGAGGDFTIAILLMFHRDTILMDHPRECGFVAFSKK